jgi:uncharacterized membrane protein
MTQPWHLYVMAILYIAAGINHFRVPKLYYKIIPPLFKNKKFFNEMAGLLEFSFGILLFFPDLYNLGCWALIILLILIFPSNIYMFTNREASLGLPKWLLLLRLPLQILLILWAYHYTTPMFNF